jgi:hypothetical protein
MLFPAEHEDSYLLSPRPTLAPVVDFGSGSHLEKAQTTLLGALYNGRLEIALAALNQERPACAAVAPKMHTPMLLPTKHENDDACLLSSTEVPEQLPPMLLPEYDPTCLPSSTGIQEEQLQRPSPGQQLKTLCICERDIGRLRTLIRDKKDAIKELDERSQHLARAIRDNKEFLKKLSLESDWHKDQQSIADDRNEKLGEDRRLLRLRLEDMRQSVGVTEVSSLWKTADAGLSLQASSLQSTTVPSTVG